MHQSRINQLDLLRAIAIIFVLIIHSSLIFASTESERIIGGWFSTFAHPCIAMFLFISGYLHARKQFDSAELLKRIKRVALPFAFFSLLALIYRFKSELLVEFSASPSGFLFHFLIGNAFGIYYFVFVIVFTYVIFFLVRKFKISTDHALILFAIITSVHAGYFNNLVHEFNLKETRLIKLYQFRYVFWPFYFLLGVFFYEHKLIDVCRKYKLYPILMWGVVFIIYNILFYYRIENIDGFNSIIGNLYSLVTIVLLISLNVKTGKLTDYLSRKSYYLYLSHIFVVYGFRDVSQYLKIQIPFEFSVVSLILSFAIPLALYEIQRIIFKDKFSTIIGV